jgi:pimeloyl-ACP methyl ester carboxylesterase
MDFTTGYAQLGDDRVAYQVIGEGSVDVVLTVGWWGSFDIEWEDAAIRSFYQHMARYARVIRFDRRGAGASDSIPLGCAYLIWPHFGLFRSFGLAPLGALFPTLGGFCEEARRGGRGRCRG